MKLISILTILFLVIAVSHATTNSDANNQDESSSNGHNPGSLIRLPTKTSDLDLTELLNRHRVNLRTRFRITPRRCRHQQRLTTFGPVETKDDLAMKKQGEVIRHRHVADKFNPMKQDAVVVYEVKEEYDGEWKAGRHHHHHHHHHHDHSDDESDDDDEVHHKVHDVHHGFNHHGHKKKKGNYIMSKIRKFLSHF